LASLIHLGCNLGKVLKTIATSASFFFLLFYCLGCGSNLTQQTTSQQLPSITQVLPQIIPAGSQTMTLKVKGTNFPTQAAILWNGASLTTTVVDSNTLSGTIGSSSLANPGTAELQVQNTQTMQASPSVPVTITDPNAGPASALTLSIASLPQGVVGASYNGTFSVTGGTSPYTWSVVSGQLPPGLSVGATTGIISGTPTSAGNYSFGVMVTDSGSSVQSATTTVSLPIVTAPPPAPTALTITSSSLPSGTIGSTYSATLESSGGTAPYAWSITSGGLPNGLSLSATTGVISGTPTGSSTTNLTATITDSSNPSQTKSVSLTLVIAPHPLAITTSSLLSGALGSTYSNSLQASGGTAPYSWSITSGSLPTGVTLAAATGIITGTPTASGTFSFTATAADASSPAQTKSVSLSIVIAPAALTITSSTLPSGTQSSSYTTALQASGGTGSYTWSIATGALPAGLSLAPASGIISGTPTVSGNNLSFGVSVKDAGSPVQTAATNLALTVVASGTPLAISTTSLSPGIKNESFSSSLNATGGTAPYIWSITNGTLPAGLAFAKSTSTISGTPTAIGTVSLTFTVTDSSSPVQSKSTTLPLTIAAPALTINATLASGTVGTAYSSPMTATGGTPAYTWSITAGSLPAGLTLAATTGIISGTPTTSGTSNFTASVSDNSSPAQTNSASTSIVVAAAQGQAGPGTTWYVRPDGGTRYSTNQTQGQCDGQADVAYSGTGTNQHCAFGDARWLWQDGSYSLAGNPPSWGWVIAGGDTVIIRGSIGSGVSWRVGWNNGGAALDNGLYYGLQGDQYNSGIPVPPSGTASQHTKILGENYAACTSQSARTQLHGGWGMYQVLDLTGASYVDLACLDITDFSDGTLPDYARNGIKLSNTSTNDTLTDIRTHGLTSAGIFGPTGTGFIMTDVAIVGNGNAGWNADLGDGTTGVGTLLVQNYEISWNGCNEEYPIVDAVPYISCRDQSTGGYGDGFGTASVDSAAPGWQLTFTNGLVSYNTQDGLDALHVAGAGSTMTVTRSLLFASEGQQIKAGGGAVATIQNNVIVGNCAGILEVIPGRPVNTLDSLGNICRANNTAVLLNVIPGHPATYQGNTLFSAGAVGVELEYSSSSNGAGSPVDTGPTNTVLYNDNVFVGFYNGSTQANPTPVYSNSDLNMLTNAGASWTNNATFGGRSNYVCPEAGESNAICTDPGLTDETYHSFGYGNMSPASGSSAVVGTGVTVPGLTVDYTGQTRAKPPSIGAYDQPLVP
jgi:hypothetical protein